MKPKSDLTNVAAYASAGAAAVGVGSALVPKVGWSAAEIRTRAAALRAAWRQHSVTEPK